MSFPIYAGARLISVAGLTECIVSCSGNDSLPNESGLVSTTATLVLRDPDGDRGRFDPVRHPSQFARGRVIRIGDHCRGYLRIANDQYVPATGELNLELADILTILNWKEPPDQLEYPKPGEPRTKFWIINYLLELAEAPALIDNIPGELECPLQRNSSLIALCGEIAASEGYYLWVDDSENVRASEIMPRSSGVSIGSGLWTVDNSINLERVRASETPVELVRVHSNGCKPKPVEPIKEYIEEIWGAFIFVEGNTENPEEEMTQLFKVDSVLLLRRSVRDEFDIVERVRSVHTITEEVFYSSSAMFADPDNFDTNVRAELILTSELFEDYFYSSEDGSLIQKIATEYKPFFSFDSGGVATAGDPILWRRVTTTYEYIDEYTKRIEEIEERSVIQDGITNADLIIYRTQYQEWEELRAEQWRWVNRVMQALGSLNPNVPNAAKYTLVLANDESFVKVGNGGETQPPAIERHPALFEIEEFPISGKAEFSPVAGAQYRVRSHDYTMNFIEDEATCDRVAAALGQLRWGRWFGCKVEAPFKNARNYRPGMRFSMKDPSARFNCIAEGFTWAFDAKSAVASWNGVSLSMPGGASTNIDLTVNTGPSQTFLPQGATLIEFGTPIPHDLPPGSSIVIGGVEIIVSEFTPQGATQVNIFPSPAPIANNSTATYTVTDDLPLYLNVKSFNAGWGAIATFELLPYPLLKPAINAIGAIGFGSAVSAPQPVVMSAGWGASGKAEVVVSGVTRTITITSTTAYTNYPLFLSNVSMAGALADGSDVRFFDSDGVTPLTYYLEPYSGASTRDIVVRVPSIPSSGSKEIFMKYGQGQNTPQSTPSAIASPLSSANLQLWVCAQDLALTDNTPVQTFTGRTGSLSEATLVMRPTYRLNQLGGKAAIEFDGTDDKLAGAIASSNTFTLFWVNQHLAGSDKRHLCYGYNAGTSGWGFGIQSLFNVVAEGVAWGTPTKTADTVWHIHSGTGTPSLVSFFSDGVTTAHATNPSTLTLGNQFSLGATPTGGAPVACRFAEAIAINAALTAADGLNIHYYLAQKYQFAGWNVPSVVVSP